MPRQGVRYLFAADTGRRVTALDELQDGASYVCSTRPSYRRLDYTRIGAAVQASRSSHHHARVGLLTMSPALQYGGEAFIIIIILFAQ